MDLGSVLLGGLVGSLFGSVIAYVGSWWLQRQATGRRERGATRAVYFEVARITGDLVVAVEVGLGMPDVSMATYEQSAAEVASFLPEPDFDKVAFAYYSLHLFCWHTPAGSKDLSGLPVVIRNFEAARDVLAKAAYTRKQMAARRTPAAT